ncbi:hypothetical protein L249_6700 [Ophiocordyceps polyrhachis-furcata BCC 54312]|uniref:NACHT domain-containing protein n=1 Tax=Ophiocordyceps polyrhachis-furcata BCC 54312 TaxID=1330021 RepID=A0A367LKD2_9HYPO|nr:hypothetical protein L249_6700 [Ophiocordyceps polyrhachis-furcata BCC 54312]
MDHVKPTRRVFRRPSHRRDFQIAIICALTLEYDAASLLVDEFWDQDDAEYGRASGDTNLYRNGRIGTHDVVLMVLPSMGKALVAGSAASLRTSYPSLKLVFLVGICGGVPSSGSHYALLGDVVIGEAIIQYDFGRQYPGEFLPKEAMERSPNKDIRTLMAYCKSRYGREDVRTNAAICLKAIQDAALNKYYRTDYLYPGLADDKLYRATYRHKHRQPSCDICSGETDRVCSEAAKASCADLGCEEKELVHRKQKRHHPCPDILIGRLASGDTVMKSGQHRDQIAKQHDIIAFEMEGAGAWDELPCVVVKGICDYADSHKSKEWQPYAAATASAVVKAILMRYTVTENPHLQPLPDNDEKLAETEAPDHGNSSLSSMVHRSAGQTLNDAILDFQDILTPAERRHLRTMEAVPGHDAVLVFTAQLDLRNRNRRGPSIASRLYSILQSVRDFADVAENSGKNTSWQPGTAARVWGIVKLTMLTVFDSVVYYGLLSKVLMNVGRFCPQVAEYRVWYSTSARIQKALCNFYASLIFLDALWETLELEFHPDIEDIRRQSSDVQEELSLARARAKYQDQQLNKTRGTWKLGTLFSTTRKEQAAQVRTSERQAGQRRQQLMDSLSTHDYLTPLKQSRRKRYSGTAHWLSRTRQFSRWMDGVDSPLFWCSGKIGSGKTVLTASVIDEILTERHNTGIMIAFFFVKFDDRQSTRAETIVKSVLRQVLEQFALTNEVEDVLEKAQTPLAELGKLTNVFQHALTPLNRLYIIIDGLDECEKPDRRELLETLSSLAALGSKISIFLAGRDSITTEINKVFPAHHHVTMSSSLAQPDIARYIEGAVQDKLESEELIVRDPSLVDEIKLALKRGAEGMFLWVAFQLFELCSKHCDDDIRRTIGNLPRDLTETFDRALERIVSQGNAKVARQAFLWIAAAKQPLSLEELGEAMFIEIGQQFSQPERFSNDIYRISSWCENLAHVDEERQIVQFPHETVRQFFVSRFSDFHIDLSEADHYIGEICVTYLNFSNFKTTLARRFQPLMPFPPKAIAQAALGRGWASLAVKDRRSSHSQKDRDCIDINLASFQRDNGQTTREKLQGNFPFLRYATVHWILHTTGFRRNKSITYPLWEKIITQGHDLVQVPWGSEPFRADSETISTWSYEARHYAMMQLLDSRRGLSDSRKTTMLMDSAGRGDLTMIDILLGDGQLPAARLRGVCQVAARSGLFHVVERLIAAGASANDALNEAARIGNVEIVQELLHAGFDTSSALEAAARNGHVEIVDKFLNAGVAPYSALCEAALNGHLHVVERILVAEEELRSGLGGEDEGRDIERLLASGSCLRQASEAAWKRGYLEIVDVLQAAEVNVEVQMQALLG